MNAFAVSAADLGSLLPELILSAAGVLLLLADAFLPRLRRAWAPLAMAAVVGASAVIVRSDLSAWTEHFGGAIETTPLTSALSLIVLLSALVALLASHPYLRREDLLGGEYPALMLWCTVGLLLMLRATELLALFLALELLSICLYALAAYHRRLSVSFEAALKYFLMGAFVSAFVLLGVALLYGATGSTNLVEVMTSLSTGRSSLLVTLGLLALVSGFAFKMSLAPFHAWAPDTYQGAASPFVAFLSVAPKAASAIVLARLLQIAARTPIADRWSTIVAFLAILSMLIGNLLALVQKDIKRMLAYSGVAHMGVLLIPMVSLDGSSWRPILVYLLAYALMNGGAFAFVALMFARPGEQHLIAELSGWGYRYPLLGGAVTVCLLSLGGIPPTLGFLGKYLVFAHAIGHHHLGLAIVGIAASLVGVFTYLRVVYVLYMKPEIQAAEGLLIDNWGRLALVIAAGGTIVVGVWPGWLLAWIDSVVSTLG